jgi:hypothetical protein
MRCSMRRAKRSQHGMPLQPSHVAALPLVSHVGLRGARAHAIVDRGVSLLGVRMVLVGSWVCMLHVRAVGLWPSASGIRREASYATRKPARVMALHAYRVRPLRVGARIGPKMSRCVENGIL